MPHNGVFVDPSEYRRNNLDFGGKRLTALAGADRKDWITFLQTDISKSEMTAPRLSRKDVGDLIA
jgi:hypothetical protein